APAGPWPHGGARGPCAPGLPSVGGCVDADHAHSGVALPHEGDPLDRVVHAVGLEHGDVRALAVAEIDQIERTADRANDLDVRFSAEEEAQPFTREPAP